MVKAKTTLVITVEYRLDVGDEKIARFMSDLAEKHGVTLGSDNYSIWEWSPTEKVTSTEVE